MRRMVTLVAAAAPVGALLGLSVLSGPAVGAPGPAVPAVAGHAFAGHGFAGHLPAPVGGGGSAPPAAPLPTHGPGSHVVVPSTWSTVPAPALAGSASIDGTACVNPTFCVAVGFVDDGGGAKTLAERWNGTAWSIVPSPSTSSSANFFDRVSCVSTTFCMAVVVYWQGSGNHHTLAEHWDGTAWSIVPSPDLNPAGSNELIGVSCVSTGLCFAVGSVEVSNNYQAGVERWNGSTWSLVSIPVASADDNELESVSCTGPAFCFAVGYMSPSSTTFDPLIERWNGTTWTIVPGQSGAAVDDSGLIGVSCFSETVCAAVGDTETPSTFTHFGEQWDGTTWKVAALPAPSTPFGALLIGVDCFGPTSCVAGGYVNSESSGFYYVNDVVVWNGSAWSLANVPNPPASSNPAVQVNSVACVAGYFCIGGGYNNFAVQFVSSSITRSGYDEVAFDGGIFNFGGAGYYGSMGGQPLNSQVVGMAVTPDGGGYWEVGGDGGIFNFGDAGYYGSMGGQHLNSPVVGIVSSADGKGYLEVAGDGGIFAFGDAAFLGSMGGRPLVAPVVGIAATPDGGGYWEVAGDGGIFAFGDAAFLGSMGGRALNSPGVGIASTPGGGYYEVAGDGGIFAYGAPFLGSMGGRPLVSPMEAMTANAAGGYYEVGEDGGLFAFGAPFAGSMGGRPLNAGVVAIAQ